LLALSLAQELLDVKFLTVHVGVVESINCGGCSFGSSFAVVRVGGEVGDHCKLAILVATELEHTDRAKLAEKCASLLFIEVIGQILGINVVENATEFALVAWLILNRANFSFAAIFLEALSCCRGVLEANETIATGSVVRGQGDLQGLDITEARAVIVEPLRVVDVVLGDLADEDVVIRETLRVGTLERVVEWQASCPVLACLVCGLVDGFVVHEVAEVLASALKGFFVLDADDGGAEGTIEFASDLRLELEDIACLLLDNQGNLVRVGGFLGEVVKVQVVCPLVVTHHLHFLFFVFLS